MMTQGKATIFRFDRERDSQPYYATYSFPFAFGMTILDVLLYVREHCDHTLSFSYCCRNGHCGLCGVVVNGAPCLSCHETAVRELVIEPLDQQAVVRDLMLEPGVYSRRIEALQLFLCREQPAAALPEYIGGDDLWQIKVASRCVECRCCDAACPLHKAASPFQGPSGFVLLARHFFDPRDDLDRRCLLRAGRIEQCIRCGKCSRVCPHQVDPAGIIRKLQSFV